MNSPPQFESEPTLSDGPAESEQTLQLKRARTSLQGTLSRYSQYLRLRRAQALDGELQTVLKAECSRLSDTLSKLDQGVIRIAVFGLVSRGKSAVLNALLGHNTFPTGPLHGVTQWPRSVRWMPAGPTGKVQVELIDTPGLDEVDGQPRAQMAQEVAWQADLILFVVAGDITRTEYRALCELSEAQKPLLLVFNKTDLYPDQDRELIAHKLQDLFRQDEEGQRLQQVISLDEVVMVAADPAPRQVRVEWPNGQITHEWEPLSPQVDDLKEKILELLNREGQALLTLNALRQAKASTATIAKSSIQQRQAEAEAMIWKFARGKAIAVGLNPFALLDVMGGFIADLALIRSLARLYGLPMTSYEASKLWKTILLHSGTLILSEWGSGLLLGLGKAGVIAGAASSGDFSNVVLTQLTAGAAQGMVAGYGSYAIGKAAQAYLVRGCTWGAEGPDTVIEELMNQLDRNTILYRLQQDMNQSWS
jgi:uncharacterized protein